MSFIINAELSDTVVAQGLPVYTAQQIGAVPLDPTTGKILSSYLPDQASLDAEVDSKIENLIQSTAGGTNTDKVVTFHQSSGDNSEIGGWGFGVANGSGKDVYIEPDGVHVESSGKSVLIEADKITFNGSGTMQVGGSINTMPRTYTDETAGVVWDGEDFSGNLSNIGIFNSKPEYSDDNISIRYYSAGMAIHTGATATVAGWIAWDMGSGTKVTSSGNESYPWLANWPNENNAFKQSDRLGGVINTSGGGSVETYGEIGSGGSIDTHGEEVAGGFIFTRASGDKTGGWINTQGGNGNGGNINTSGGTADGGSIDTSNGGGPIDTRYKGSIGLGFIAERTSLVGTATSQITISLPNKSGTIALRSQNDAYLKAVDYDLGKTTTPNTALLSQIAGSELRHYTDYVVSEIVVQIKSRYKTQPLSTNFYTIPALQAYPRENYIYNSSSYLALTAVGTPYTAPTVGSFVKIDNEYVLITEAWDLVNGARNIRVRRAQMGTDAVAHNAGLVFGIYENTAMFSTPPAISVYNNSTSAGYTFGYVVSSDCSIGTRPLVGNYSRSSNLSASSVSAGRQVVTSVDVGSLAIQLTTAPVYISTVTTTALTATSQGSTGTIPVTANSAFTGASFYARITSTNGTEIVYVLSGGGGASWSVLRGVYGTIAIAHATGATISTNIGSTGNTALLADVTVRLSALAPL